ncbi:hypothetical protein A79E_4887 [Klebsiella pneumoniae subsp. pneumoniae 1084]|nr:hypothetical protein A79E_4887 [Klebsiella pneumoniae subsp. pneumoniae 1084]
MAIASCGAIALLPRLRIDGSLKEKTPALKSGQALKQVCLTTNWVLHST